MSALPGSSRSDYKKIEQNEGQQTAYSVEKLVVLAVIVIAIFRSEFSDPALPDFSFSSCVALRSFG